ncbi:nidogen-2 isoform X2 [Syngnathoides biaculeatus]|uniref:nidogen-2 isoform X2 n=1 Tax=Syngnathoides biaculeatus TaxID=300417 RepID=UPI002ADD5E3A|nr:nidogen-2 isoform X2 [Syngnathoides biaculeatus]
MERGQMLPVYLVSLCCSLCAVAAIQRAQMFPFGLLSGDSLLEEGDDETSKVLSLPKPFYFYDTPFSQLYVATNGIISAQDLPMEKQYVDDGFPTDFPAVAPFLADMDTSGGRGQIYYRVTETPGVLNRVAREVHQGFPDAKFTPTHAVVATWENVAAYEEPTRTSGEAMSKVNTFQAVIGYDETDSYVLFLYPEGGLNFFGTRPKESYNVEIELAARVGFSRGEITYLIFSRTEGPYYTVTSNEQSIKHLNQVGNTGIAGVWLFHTGNRYSFDNIVPASVGGLPATPSPRKHDKPLGATTRESHNFQEYTDNRKFDSAHREREGDFPLAVEDREFQTVLAGESFQPGSADLPLSASVASQAIEELPMTLEPRLGSEVVARQHAPLPPQEAIRDGGTQRSPEQQPQVPVEVGGLAHRNEPPLTPGGHVVSVEEDVDFDTGVIQYTTENKETCARFQQQCSQNAFCSDYATGFCCHCQAGFYGNGRHCLPDAAPQRVSGKLSGTVTVGLTPVELNNIDLHAYIVVGDGRAYTAVSEIPEPVGWALMPAAPIGEVFGWLFALELPNSQAGFKTTGAEFTRHAELVFHPGNQRLSITQMGRGLDDHNHLTVDTVLSGSVPFLPPASEVTMDPFKEIYHYYPSVATSSSVRAFTVVSPDRGSESFSFQLKQNITYRDCRHGNRAPPVETLQITMERVFVMYVKEERILRYAITNKISPVGAGSAGPELVNPCYDGSHDCDTTAQCVPLEDKAFQCRCGTGYRGDGHNCYDVDECAEALPACGAHSQCINLPGSHRCQCQRGFEFGFDGRTCVDTDECSSSPCHINARCTNSLGSFHCQCQNGFYGDGFLCSQQGPTDKSKSQCEQHRDRLQSEAGQTGQSPIGVFIPQCDSDGQYRPLQCHGSTGHCWCVDNRGQERAGTRTPPGTEPTDCDRQEQPVPHKTPCECQRDRVQTTSPEGDPVVGAFVPQCDTNGQYTPQQCHSSSGHCWCVDSKGRERPGTRTSPGTTPINCERADERLKTLCEHHRDSVQTTSPEGYPLVGAFVPQCDANGQYTPLQCHGSTGHCWCVDSQGQERPRTRTSPGAPPTDCDKPEEPDRTKTNCERHRDSVKTTSPGGYPLVGVFVPQCDANGQYTARQCHNSSGHCWCVDSQGQERPSTRTPPGATPTDCNKPEHPKSHCEQHRDSVETTSPEGYPILGAFVPQCDSDGHYTPLQCHSSTGHCWCVDSQGQEIPGTRTPPGTTPTDCNNTGPDRLKSHCEEHRDSVQTTSPEGYPLVGAFVPQCDANGEYTPQQCHGSSGYCWCVDKKGQERHGTRTLPGATPIDCNKPERPKSHCELHRDGIQTTSPEGYPLVGAFVPQCDDDGHYTRQQCHGSTGHCWCVDSQGKEKPGTRTAPGATPIDCDNPGHPKSQCEQHRDSIQTTSPEGYPILGAFVPQCDANGQYSPQQCHSSSGHSWCVDRQGQERSGTRTPPGVTPMDCERTERPKSHCELHRDSIQTTSPEGYPIVGAFVPQCDADGHYTRQQCHGSTGHCWCVDSQGQERPGTRTPPGATPSDCDEPGRPKSHCELHRDGIQTTSPEGYPIVGAYVPQCDADGHYSRQQCHGSTGHCWCVDSQGQERPGTRTPPGATPIDCDEPERPKSQCELHRDSIKTTSPEGYPIVGAFVPQCDADGHYTHQQCHGSTGHCWCVDSQGQERHGTRTPPGATPIDCDKPERPKSHCELHRDRIQTTGPGTAFLPQCDGNGQYAPQQCHSSTGHCWCVDSEGQERPGTRTSPGETAVNCDKPDHPKTHCEQHRDSLQTTSPSGSPILGAFVPQCDAQGQYTPQQCHGSSGHCWCVDSQGQERPGTRTPPGATPIDCDNSERPKSHCEHQRDHVQITSPEGYPLVGVFIPQCDSNGRYTPQQCQGSTGHCWCVDSQGQERPRTRTPPGTTPVDCERLDEHPKTLCEHHRESVQTRGAEGFPLVGAFVPQCDANGQFTPQQCHGSIGECWCVDSNGQERPGTRSPPGVSPIDCDGPIHVTPTERPESVCERWRSSLMEHYGGKPGPQQYLPQCEPDGQFSPIQCYGETTYCWCVDQDGREVLGTRSNDVIKPACLPSVAPPTVRPLPRPDVTPPPNTDITLLYAQGQKIGALPLNGSRLDTSRSKTLLTLHGSIVVGLSYDCKQNQVYWTDLSARTINRALMSPGAEPEILINSNLVSPEGLAVDVNRRLMFWVDSNPDLIERSSLDGSDRRTLFDTDLVNPRAIIVVSSTGSLYWTDWNREAPKIESASVDGQNRRVVVSEGIGLPNALTYDYSSGHICWADAGTKRLECIFPDGSGRRVINPSLNYPFSMVYHGNHFYYTDWRRDGVITVSKDSGKLTDEYLPEQRSHLYGITIATSHCLSAAKAHTGRSSPTSIEMKQKV